MSQGVVYQTADSRIIAANPAAAEILGLTRDQLFGITSFDPLWRAIREDGANLPAEEHPGMVALRTGKPVENYIMGVFNPAKTGFTWIRVNAQPLFYQGTKSPSGIFVTFEDITAQHLAEAALHDNENRFRALFSAMKEMVVLHQLVYDANNEAVNYRILDCNDAFLRMMGLTREQTVGELVTELYKCDTPPYMKEYQKVAQTGQPYEYTTYYPPMDKYFTISAVSPTRNQFATITNDITASRQMHEIMAARNKELENYLYISSHDLRTPLVNIQGFSQRLQKQTVTLKTLVENCKLPAEEKTDFQQLVETGIPKTLSFILSGVNKMDTLLNALLQLSRTGRTPLNVKLVGMNKLFEKVIAAQSFQISETESSIRVENLPNCYGDENLLNQMFSNLISNAIKYRDRGRPLVIEVNAISGFKKVIYSIKDNGPGIEKKHLDQLWNLFYRVDSSNQESGDGIGLSVVKKIAEKHRGKVKVESEPGVGSVFSVVLMTTEFQDF